MELRQIRYFIEVARREHMTEAANALLVAQSAVSRQIVNLEAELGVDLFIREGRNIRLTPIGRMFLEKMEQAMDMINQARREIEEYTMPEKGTVRIGFPSSFAAYLLPTIISAFRKEYPDVQFQLHQTSYKKLIAEVVEGEIDMALLAPVPVKEKRVNSEVLFVEHLVALLYATHPLASRKLLQLDDMRGHPFILSPEGYILREIVEKACRQHGFEPDVPFVGKDIDAIKGLVSAGLGITLLPEITLTDSLPRSTVKIRLKEPYVTRTVGVIIPSNRELLPTVSLFHTFIKSFFRNLSGYR